MPNQTFGYSNLLDQYFRDLMRRGTEMKEQKTPELARRGVLTSPYGESFYADIDKVIAEMYGTKAAELGWGEFQTQRQRGWELEDWQREEALARELAEMYRLKEPSDFEKFLQYVIGPAAQFGGAYLGTSLAQKPFLSALKAV